MLNKSYLQTYSSGSSGRCAQKMLLDVIF